MQLYWTKQGKYYKLIEQKTLFGIIDVVCVWGRIGGNLGGYKIIPCATKEELDLVIDLVKKKRQYRPISRIAAKKSYSVLYE